MGIGRQRFTQQFYAELSVLTAAGLVEGIVGDVYVNRAHALAFRVPKGWEVQDVNQTVNSQAGIGLEFQGLDAEAFAEYIRSKPVHTPFVTVADLKGARFVPEATSTDVDHMATLAFVAFEGTWEDDGPLGDEPLSLLWFVERDLAYFATGYRDFLITHGPNERTISGCVAVEYVAQYSFAHSNLPFTVPMRERAVYVNQDPAIHCVRMVDYPAAEPPLTFNYDDFIESLRFM